MKNAFTLMEVLVVVIILGILAAIALPLYEKAVWKSRTSEVKVFAASFAEAQSVYRLNRGSFAQDFSELDIKF